ncbi:MAG: EthD family reductase [Gammaproteobacteria bacterium]|nr:EthD family reductase [Gammaproteobacteria bacterium]
MLKVLVLVHRRPGLTHEEFTRGYRDEVGPAVAQNVPGVIRYAQNHHPQQRDGSDAPWDGVGELWLADLAAWQRVQEFAASPAGQAVVDLEAKYIDRSRMTILVCDEVVMKDDGAEMPRPPQPLPADSGGAGGTASGA